MIPRVTCAALVLTTVGTGAPAAPVQQSFRVGANVVAGCEVSSVAGASWGSIDLGTVSGVAGGTVRADMVSGGVAGLSVDCTPGTMLSATADLGTNALGGVRRLALPGNATARIPYRLFATSAQTEWTTQTLGLAFPVGVSRQTLPISAIATLPGSQAAGAYSDIVRVTLSW